MVFNLQHYVFVLCKIEYSFVYFHRYSQFKETYFLVQSILFLWYNLYYLLDTHCKQFYATKNDTPVWPLPWRRLGHRPPTQSGMTLSLQWKLQSYAYSIMIKGLFSGTYGWRLFFSAKEPNYGKWKFGLHIKRRIQRIIRGYKEELQNSLQAWEIYLMRKEFLG